MMGSRFVFESWSIGRRLAHGYEAAGIVLLDPRRVEPFQQTFPFAFFPEVETVAVNVTLAPAAAGFCEDVRDVVVGVPGTVIVTLLLSLLAF